MLISSLTRVRRACVRAVHAAGLCILCIYRNGHVANVLITNVHLTNDQMYMLKKSSYCKCSYYKCSCMCVQGAVHHVECMHELLLKVQGRLLDMFSDLVQVVRRCGCWTLCVCLCLCVCARTLPAGFLLQSLVEERRPPVNSALQLFYDVIVHGRCVHQNQVAVFVC